MVSNDAFRRMALSLAESIEAPHFEKASFRVARKIFATLDQGARRACLKFSEENQSMFCSHDRSVIYPVPNKWGKMGWTFVELRRVRKTLLSAALTAAYCHVAPKKLAARYI
jgi:hypothetical protein